MENNDKNNQIKILNIGFYVDKNISDEIRQNIVSYALLNQYMLKNKSTLILNYKNFIDFYDCNCFHRTMSVDNLDIDLVQQFNIDYIYYFSANDKIVEENLKNINLPVLIHGYKNSNENNIIRVSITKLPFFSDPNKLYTSLLKGDIQSINTELLQTMNTFQILFSTHYNNFYKNKIEMSAQVAKVSNISEITKLPPKQLQTKFKIKIMCNWCDTNSLYKSWGKLSHNLSWKQRNYSILLTEDSKEADYFILINGVCTEEFFDPSKTILFIMEPNFPPTSFYNWFQNWIKKFDKPLDESFLYYMDHKYFYNNTEWWLSYSVQELNQKEDIFKTKLLSTIVSSQYDMEGHKYRIDLIKYIQSNSNLDLDIFGISNKFNFNNYKGALPHQQKENGLLPYKYSIAVENCSIENYFTEKITDCIISECLCFYWGCKNIETLINPYAFIRLDPNDFSKSLNIIKTSIENNEWEKRIGIIKQEKFKLVNNFNLFPRVCSLLEVYQNFEFFSYLTDLQIPGIKLSYYNNKDTNDSIIEKLKYTNKIGVIINKIPKNNFLDNLCHIISNLPLHFNLVILGNSLSSNINSFKTIIPYINTITNDDKDFCILNKTSNFHESKNNYISTKCLV